MIMLNMYGQLIVPIEAIVKEFGKFLGIIAKNSKLDPLDYLEWSSVPTHYNIWQYVLV